MSLTDFVLPMRLSYDFPGGTTLSLRGFGFSICFGSCFAGCFVFGFFSTGFSGSKLVCHSFLRLYNVNEVRCTRNMIVCVLEKFNKFFVSSPIRIELLNQHFVASHCTVDLISFIGLQTNAPHGNVIAWSQSFDSPSLLVSQLDLENFVVIHSRALFRKISWRKILSGGIVGDVYDTVIFLLRES